VSAIHGLIVSMKTEGRAMEKTCERGSLRFCKARNGSIMLEIGWIFHCWRTFSKIPVARGEGSELDPFATPDREIRSHSQTL
jgi:hypothetical protein